jgi:hypothetical protein
MFEISTHTGHSGDSGSPGDTNRPGGTSQPGDAGRPVAVLEAAICELAGHLTAATCRFLVLLGEFDARQGWAGCCDARSHVVSDCVEGGRLMPGT